MQHRTLAPWDRTCPVDNPSLGLAKEEAPDAGPMGPDASGPLDWTRSASAPPLSIGEQCHRRVRSLPRGCARSP